MVAFALVAAASYPYLTRKGPIASGLIQTFVLFSAWFVAALTGAYSGVWFLATLAQVATMAADPLLFPAHATTSPHAKTRGKRGHILKDRYSNDEVPEDLDAVVIGSGIGGLATAALMARAGKKVLVLEQHYRAGGCTHTFDEFGNLFDSGIHYVGAEPTLQTMLSYLISGDAIDFYCMGKEEDGYTYDHFDMGSKDGTRSEFIEYRKGMSEVKAELVKNFPEEKEGIEAYLEFLKSSQMFMGIPGFGVCECLAVLKLAKGTFLDTFVSPFRAKLEAYVEKFTARTADEVIKTYVKDQRLVALLGGGQLIDWNMKPDIVSWFVPGQMMNYYLKGGYYPIGGSHLMAERIIPTIENAGGRVLMRARVSSIVVEDGKAVGVQVGKDFIPAKQVISDAGGVNTYEKLLSQEDREANDINPPYIEQPDGKAPSLACSNGHMTAFVNLKGNSESNKLKSGNIHSYLDLPKYGNDISKMQEAFYEDPLNTMGGCLVTLTCPSAKDPIYEATYPDSSCVLLLTEAKHEWFDESTFGECGGHGKRTDKYKEFKDKFKEMFLERLYMYYPETKGKVVGEVAIGSPLSTEFYIEAPKGGSYGLEWSPAHFNKENQEYLDFTTKIENLYLTGEAPFFGGLCGAMTSGFLAAWHVLGVMPFAQVMLGTDTTVRATEKERSILSDWKFMAAALPIASTYVLTCLS
jgi:phytoene dehydrogenase-like protein